ncbi:WXG100 family type VII secretion target [Streptomyces sp. Je 1-79]|uniref:WXG100 family type VII secretion target n=1 Tax=Streptomyces sp. Je 1-79 TaxID=2943847 RepID=UPI0021A7B831|nr:WXG100 family type VII secretion target [Streptomyces sp. Je 1-79]MCT4354061.1 WXG100 family type VII secretion target [Streptomyces sp. Je 1-79]
MAQNNDGVMVVTYASLDDAAGVIEKQAAELDRSLEEIQTRIRSISETFEGEAKTAADAAHKNWDKESRLIHTALKDIASKIRMAGPAYQAGDRKSAANF